MTPVPVILRAAGHRELVERAAAVRAARPADLTGYARDLAAAACPDERYRVVLLVSAPGDLAHAEAAARAAEPLPVPGPVAFLFAGQSSQRPGMGEQLGREFAEFDRIVGQVCGHADPHDTLGLRSAMAQPGGAEIDRADIAQPALLAVGLGLFRLLDVAGIEPDVVAGHSFGEYVAAAASGVWTLPDACAVVTARGRLIAGLPSGGGMVAIEAPAGEVTAALPPGVVISAVHGESSVAVAGPLPLVHALADDFAARGVRTARLNVANAYHSPTVDPVLAPLAAAIAAVPARPPAVPLVGNATGDVAERPQTAEHWTRHCRAPVYWSAVLDTLRARSVHSYVEVGPSGVLSRLSAQHLGPDLRDAVLPALQAEPDEPTAFLAALAHLDARGHPVDWPAVFAASRSLGG